MCGQWGIHGYQKNNHDETAFNNWQAVLKQLAHKNCYITLWGGEPLLAPGVFDLARKIKDSGHKLAVVTNGTLLEKHADDWVTADNLFISIDGPAEIHDTIRGIPGCFDRIDRGIRKIRKNFPLQKISILTTLLEENYNKLTELGKYLSGIPADCWILGPQIFLSRTRLEKYRSFLDKMNFPDCSSGSWLAEFPPGLGKKIEQYSAELITLFPELDIKIGGHGFTPGMIEKWYDKPDSAPVQKCYAPWRRLSIRSDGSTSFCLDITDGSLGGISEHTPAEIFSGQIAENFRNEIRYGGNPACSRCIWNLHPEDYRYSGKP